jgi:omega-amidase
VPQPGIQINSVLETETEPCPVIKIKPMRITIVQNDIIWEQKLTNLAYYNHLLSGLSGKTDLVVLPEMCTTGFSMESIRLAESNDEESMTIFRQMSKDYGMAITGSFMGKDKQKKGSVKDFAYFNRGFFVCPDGKETFYDKRHLFRMGEESKNYKAGKEKCLISYMGWNIRLVICYDLRFPVWCRNTNNEYDLLVVVANWPASREHVWTNLLTARALENMAYVCGVNRIGTDRLNLHYTGDSQLINAYGVTISSTIPDREQIQTLDIDHESLDYFREKFPAWKDADRFKINL